MPKRKIIKIDENKCNGCGLCVPNCPEGALQIIDKKARLISDLFCDGLGACIGHCPEGAITIEERDAEPYDEKKVMENIVKQGKNVIKAHLEHLRSHNAYEYFGQALEVLEKKGIKNPLGEGFNPHKAHAGHACPGSKVMDFRKSPQPKAHSPKHAKIPSQLRQWPVQLHLVPPFAPYLKDADLLIAADCVPFAYADFHNDLLKGKILLVGCPKLDDIEFYKEKLAEIIKNNGIKSVTCAHMEVPCCFGLVDAAKSAISAAKKEIPFENITITIQGNRK